MSGEWAGLAGAAAPAAPTEEQVEIGPGDQGLAGVLHRPAGGAPRSGLVLCPGFPKSKAESDFGFVLAARRFSRSLAVLRFDYGGLGDSPGCSQDVTLAGMVGDARRALEWLAGWLAAGRAPGDPSRPRLALLGFGLGAAVAARAARPVPGAAVAAVALWSPAFEPLPGHRGLLLPSGLEVLEREGRADMADLADWEAERSPSRDYFARLGAEPKNARGLLVGLGLLEELAGVETLGPARALGLPLLVVLGSEAGPLLGRPPEGGDRGAGWCLHVVAGANHLFTRPRWKEEAIEVTAAFLEASLGVERGR